MDRRQRSRCLSLIYIFSVAVGQHFLFQRDGARTAARLGPLVFSLTSRRLSRARSCRGIARILIAQITRLFQGKARAAEGATRGASGSAIGFVVAAFNGDRFYRRLRPTSIAPVHRRLLVFLANGRVIGMRGFKPACCLSDKVFGQAR